MLDLIKLKSKLVCSGIQINDISEKIYDFEHKSKITRTSNMGLQLDLEGKGIICSIPYRKNNPFKSPWYLFEKDDKYYLTDDNITIEVKYFPNEVPTWYNHMLSNGRYISDYIQFEGDKVLICSISRTCCYFSKNEACAFCNLNGGFTDIDEKEYINMIIESFKYILNCDQSAKSINLTGGNLYTSDKGALRYIPIIKEIRKLSRIPIAVELSPPDDLNVLKELYLAGANALEMNVEIWDEEIRNKLMPGKSKINREYYIKAWEKAIEIFGVGNVGSGIIIGLDDVNSSFEGIKKMIDIGVLPSIIPFKPTPGSVLEEHVNCVSDDLYNITDKAAKLMLEKGLDPTDKYGCIGCGACTLEGDLYRYYKKNTIEEKL